MTGSTEAAIYYYYSHGDLDLGDLSPPAIYAAFRRARGLSHAVFRAGSELEFFTSQR